MSDYSDKRTISGVLPPYMAVELIRYNPELSGFGSSLDKVAQLYRNAQVELASGVLDQARGVSAEAKRIVFDARGRSRVPTTNPARTEGQGPVAEALVNLAYENDGKIREFYKEKLGRNSMDNQGMDFQAVVNYAMENAYWDGVRMVCGLGDDVIFRKDGFTRLGVVAHERAHGKTEHMSGLVYYGQSGATNESLSDADCVQIEQFVYGHTVDKATWLIGSDLFAPSSKPGVVRRGLRDMLNPGTAYNDPQVGKDPQPDHMDRYVRTSADNGGVHYNSGIPNRAFALFAIAVGGYSWEVAGRVWHLATIGLSKNSQFVDFAKRTIEVCTRVFPDHAKKCEDAWRAVGVIKGKLV